MKNHFEEMLSSNSKILSVIKPYDLPENLFAVAVTELFLKLRKFKENTKNIFAALVLFFQKSQLIFNI